MKLEVGKRYRLKSDRRVVRYLRGVQHTLVALSEEPRGKHYWQGRPLFEQGWEPYEEDEKR